MNIQMKESLAGALALGLVQGITEFLPVSSSGHLVVGGALLGSLLGTAVQSLLFDTLLHVGTLLPVLWLYRADVVQLALTVLRPRSAVPLSLRWEVDRGLRLAVFVVLATLPTAIIGVTLEHTFEQLFGSLRAVGVTFLITGGILMLTRLRPGASSPGEPEPADSHLTLSCRKALLIGLAQGVAITPGISRSGSTIAAALLLGVERTMAARFSFLLSIPAILGAVVLQLRKLHPEPGMLQVYFAGALVAAVSGYLALRFLVGLVRRGQVHWFSYYLWPLGCAVLIYTLVF